jgi:hypothetical protein
MKPQPPGQAVPLTMLECYLIGYMRRVGCINSRAILNIAYAWNVDPTKIIKAMKRLIRLQIFRAN